MARRYKYEKVVEIIESKGCKLISKNYINSSTKMEVICSCGNHIFLVNLHDFVNGKVTCEICSGKISWNYEKVKQYAKEQGVVLISKEYKNSKTKMEFKCIMCGKSYNTDWSTFLKWEKYTCNECSNKIKGENQKHNYQEVKNLIESLSDCKLLSKKYVHSKDKLELLCGCKNHTFKTSLNSFLRGKQQCEYCSNHSKWNLDKVKQWALSNSDCELLATEYIDCKTKMPFKCICGEVFYTNLNSFITENKKQCNVCGVEIRARKLSNSYEDVYDEISTSGCELLSDTYINTNSPLIIKCSECGEPFECSLDEFRVKTIKACPYCNIGTPTGEKILKNLFVENNIEYIPQYTFDDCKYKKLLRFDFYLPKTNYCVEVDGKQHREPVDFFGGEEAFEELKIKDEIKNKYCQLNGINLIRIPYERENIEYFTELCNEIIKNILN